MGVRLLGGMRAMIHCSNLTKDYKSFKKTGWLKLRRSKSAEVFRAVDNITFDIGAGEVVGYIGPNGAGKSTTIKMMCGILTPTSGELTVNGLVLFCCGILVSALMVVLPVWMFSRGLRRYESGNG